MPRQTTSLTSPEEVNLFRDFGVRADGATDNAARLVAMRDELVAHDPLSHYELVLPAGVLLSSYNGWLVGLDAVTLIGYDTTLISTDAGPWAYRKQPIGGGSMFQFDMAEYGDADGEYNAGATFASAVAGGYTVTVDNEADIADLTAGDSVFLGGFEQQASGYPVNNRYFEWKTVEEVSSDTVTFTSPLKENYFDDWHDVPNMLGAGNGSGKPRLWNLRKDRIWYPSSISIHGVRLGLSQHEAGGSRGGLFLPARKLTVCDAYIEGSGGSTENEDTRYDSCVIGEAEFDKLSDKVYCKNVDFLSGIGGATGVNKLTIDGGSAKGTLQVAPRKLRLINGFTAGSNTSSPTVISHPAEPPVRLIELDDFRCALGPDSSAAFHIQFLGEFVSFTVDDNDGADIVLDYGGFADAAFDVIKAIDYGDRLFKADGSKSGVVTGIRLDGSEWKISGTWAEPAASETWYRRRVQNIVDRGVRSLDGVRIWDKETGRFAGNVGKVGPRRNTILTQNDLVVSSPFTDIDIYGKIHAIEVMVGSPYTGDDATAQLILRTAADVTFATLNLKESGLRRITSAAIEGLQTGDDTDLASWPEWFTALHIVHVLTDHAVNSLPELSISIDWSDVGT